MNRKGGALFTFYFIPFLLFAQSEVQKHFDEGNKALKAKDYLKAVGDFTNALSIRANYGEAYYLRAKAKWALGEEMGFENTEACSDVAWAIRYGYLPALEMAEQRCFNECYDTKMAFNEPEIVYCADFSSKVLVDLPPNTVKLNQILRLNLFNNKITKWPTNLSQLITLVQLDLSANKMQQIGTDISKLQFIKDLNLSKNLLTELPYEFGNLEHLTKLNLRSNMLEDMPKSIARLKNLEVLDLSLNKLNGLPMEITNLKKLKILHLVGNDISAQQQAIITKLLPNTTIYFE